MSIFRKVHSRRQSVRRVGVAGTALASLALLVHPASAATGTLNEEQGSASDTFTLAPDTATGGAGAVCKLVSNRKYEGVFSGTLPNLPGLTGTVTASVEVASDPGLLFWDGGGVLSANGTLGSSFAGNPSTFTCSGSVREVPHFNLAFKGVDSVGTLVECISNHLTPVTNTYKRVGGATADDNAVTYAFANPLCRVGLAAQTVAKIQLDLNSTFMGTSGDTTIGGPPSFTVGSTVGSLTVTTP